MSINHLIKSTGDTIYFWRQTEQPYGCFSNWADTPFSQGNLSFKSTEHYLMYYKALLMGDQEMALAILNANTCKRAKDLGQKVQNWNEAVWVANREQIMYNGILLKCRAFPEIAKLLVDTGNREIAEASPYDKIWGIGYKAQMAILKNRYNGLNLLGIALMKVRNKLQMEMKEIGEIGEIKKEKE